MKINVIFFLLLCVLHTNDAQSICSGRDFILDHTNVSLMLSQLQYYFTNCEYIYGNLEIIFPQLTDIPGQFSDIFSPVREIQGYLLFENIRTETLNLSNLVIIRGEANFTVNGTQNALVLKNTQINTLLLTNLKEITNFGVYVYNEVQNISSACNLYGINWVDIANASNVYLSANCPSQNCTGCFPSYCWTENNCQMLTLINCTCNGGRCVTNSPTECCDTDLCSAGCTASTTCNACSACRRFVSGSDTCVLTSSCIPSNSIRAYSFLTPPALSGSCNPPLAVDPMPGSVEFCSLECPSDECIEVVTNELRCRGCGPLENECIPYPNSQEELPALSVPLIPKAPCNFNTINSIVLGQESFAPSNPITPSYLNVFRNVTVISDYLVIGDFPSYYGDAFSFLSSLEIIEGNTLYMGEYSLYITGNSFRQIDLRSLNSIAKGAVLIENNTNLCYLPTMSGFTTLIAGSQNIQVQNSSCLCHSLCESDTGCWGPSNSQCIECSVVEIENVCEANCDSRPNTFSSSDSKECVACDPLCINCTGLATNCTECLNVSLVSGECRASCPEDTFQNETDCIPCSSNCDLTSVVDGSSCLGPTDNFGSNGCNECKLYQPQANSSSNYTCVSECVNSYVDVISVPGSVCRPCNPACTRCTGPSVEECDTTACARFLEDDLRCVLTCSNETRFIPSSPAKTCTSCDTNCIGCNGVSNTDCTNCRTLQRENQCVSNCPSSEFANNTSVCEACNELCSSCIGTRDNCISCALAELIKNGTRTCLAECPPGYYRAANLTCLLCNAECFNCTGALATDCEGRCRNFQLFPADQCVSVCPDTAQINNATKTCTIISASLNAAVIAGISVGGFIFILIVFGVVIFIVVGGLYSRKYKKEKEKGEQGTLLPLREQGNIQRTIEGMPELTLLGFNYETLADVTPAVFPLQVIHKSALDLQKLLGKGFYGSVYAGHYTQHSNNGFPVAVKNLNENGLKMNFEDAITNAMQDISKFTHHSFVQVLGYNPSINSPFIVTQLLIGPSLYNLFSKYPGCIDENKIFKYIVQVGEGLLYLERQGFVHGLLTSRNVLLENQDRIKLTDFFLHRFSDPIPENALNLPIQERWMSPELALTHNPTNKSDVWGFGVLFWELLSFAQLPYDRVPDDAVVAVLQQGQRLPQPTACSVDLYGYLLQCFIFDPSGRPTFEKLQEELVEMSKFSQKYISVQQVNLYSTKTNELEQARISESTNLVIGNANANTLTQQDIPTDELGIGEYVDEEQVNRIMDSEHIDQTAQDKTIADLGLGEYVDEEQVNRKMDSEHIDQTAQDKTIEDLGLGEYVDEEQVNKLIDAESIDQLISDDGVYSEINQVSSVGASAVNEYEEVDVNPKKELNGSLQFPNFISIHNPVSSNVNSETPVNSLDLNQNPNDLSPPEEPTVFISPNTSIFSPYETIANQNAKV